MNCPECSAPGSLRQKRFDELLALEFSDRAYGAVHHLTVTTFMLQHSSKLSREGWLYERELLREFLVDNRSPELIRRQNKDLVDSGRRKFKFVSKDGKPVINQIPWTKTILDVHTENVEDYCKDIETWARSALEDVEGLEL